MRISIIKDLLDDEIKIIKGIGSDATRILIIRPNSVGDYSIYRINLVNGINQNEQNGLLTPPDNFDVILSAIDFSFKFTCAPNFDCINQQECPPPHSQGKLPMPIIDYMAKDFSSFRKLMLDRLSLIMPDWKERNVADMGIALVELLAYVGDHLSYYQDAVSTEAYLGTARKRISIKRHTRLLDYFIHEGCNSRTWICLEIFKEADGFVINKKTKLLSGDNTNFDSIGNGNKKMNTLTSTTTTSTTTTTNIIVRPNDLEKLLVNGSEVFETMFDIVL